MNRVDEITKEIKKLEINISLLKKELQTIQRNCVHEFQNKNSIQECLKCHLIESLSW